MIIRGASEPPTYCLDPTRVQTHVSVAHQMTACKSSEAKPKADF